jgi:hypothetical protein
VKIFEAEFPLFLLRSTVLSLLPVLAFAASAPQLGDDKISAIKGTQKVVIAEFGVEFFTQMAGGSNQSGTTAFATSRLRGVDDADFQAITDQAYGDTVAELKAAGFEVLAPELVKANTTYQELAHKYGQDAPYTLTDSSFGKGDPVISKTFTAAGLKAFFSTSNGTGRGSIGQRTDAQNQWRGDQEGEIAKALGATLLHVHYLVGFATIKDHGHRVLFSTGSATVKTQLGTNLFAKDTEWQFVNETGKRAFTTSSRARHTGAAFLDEPLASSESIYSSQDSTSSEQKRSDGVANAVGMALGTLLGNSSISSTKSATIDVTPSSVDAYRKDTGQLIGSTAVAFAKALGAAK